MLDEIIRNIGKMKNTSRAAGAGRNRIPLRDEPCWWGLALHQRVCNIDVRPNGAHPTVLSGQTDQNVLLPELSLCPKIQAQVTKDKARD